jgi:transcriptional regulator with XRE-family HTH domain
MMDQEVRKAFGERLKHLRNQKGWTQKELAFKVEIGFSQFNKYEMGLHIPSLEKLIQLAELLDSTLDYLLTGDSNDQVNLHDTRLAKRFKELEQFQAEDKEAIIRILDGMIIKNRTQSVMSMDDAR